MSKRTHTSVLAAGLALLTLAAGGCGGSSPSAPNGLEVKPIQIDSVEVEVGNGSPATVVAHVTGVVGDGCAKLLPPEQSRSGSQVGIDIRRERPTDAVCIQIAQLYDERLRLDGDFARGTYVLRVNAVERSFVVP